MMDHREAAVRALPEHLRRRMAHFALAGWDFAYCEHAVGYASPPMFWLATYKPGTFEGNDGNLYTPKMCSSPSLLTLLDQMVGVMEVRDNREADRRCAALGSTLMTEEDQILVAKAGLAGVRFWRGQTGYWKSSVMASGMLTLPRAAARALVVLGLLDRISYNEYERRTKDIAAPQDVDIASLAVAIDADLPPR